MAGHVEVPRAPLRPPSYGLTSTARDATGDPAVGSEVAGEPARWENGVSWQPNCPNTLGTWRDCTDAVASGGPSKTIIARPDVVNAAAYTIWAGDQCSTLGGLTQDRQERAQEQLIASQSRAMELILQNGLSGITVPYLRDANLVDLSPGAASSPLVYALAALEEAASDAEAFIHCTLSTAILWYSARAIEKVGNLLYSPLGTPIIAGSGYTGANPAGTIDPTGETAYAYITGRVQYRLSPITVLGDERSIDRAANTWTVRAERFAQATFEPCIQAGIAVNLCETFCAPASS